MDLYHYFEKGTPPFRNLSDLPLEEADAVLNAIRASKPQVQCAARQPSYNADRRYYEDILRREFIKKGGLLQRAVPHYMTVEHSPWLSTWYTECDYIRIPIEEFDLRTLSFTYGDSHPTFSPRVTDKKEYRKKLYTYDEILQIIAKYGLPQHWNNDGRFGPERYIEVHVWSDETISRFR
ncbi:MAG: hypothetical protein IJX84_04335 [Clostridia bacterium]|nr:hypothetical protein [Clostridia bacterium]